MEKNVEQKQSSEPPPRFSVQGGAAVRECLVRSPVPVGGGRSPLALGHIRAMLDFTHIHDKKFAVMLFRGGTEPRGMANGYGKSSRG